MADKVFKSIKDIPEIQEPEFDDSIYKNKSLDELDKLGFEGWHNVIVNNLRNSAYDSADDAIAAAEKHKDWTPKQKAYVRAYANQVFGVDPEDEAEGAAIRKAADEQDRQVLERQKHRDALIAKIRNAKKNGQNAQTALDTVSYDADLEPGTPEFENLKNLIKNEYK